MRLNYTRRFRGGVDEGKHQEGRYRGSGLFWKRLLEESVSGGEGAGWLTETRDEPAQDIPKASASGVRSGVELRFEVGEKGVGRSQWQAETVEVLSLKSGAKSVWAVEALGELEALTGRVIVPTTPEDPVCRLKVEFSRLAGFEPGELWRTMPVKLPRTGMPGVEPVMGAEFDGARVRVHSLTAPGGVVPGPFRDFWNRWMGDKSAFTLWMEVTPAGADRRLTLVSAVDERGRPAKVTAGLWSGEQYAFGLIPPAGATGLSFTFALHRSRVMELLVDTRKLNGDV